MDKDLMKSKFSSPLGPKKVIEPKTDDFTYFLKKHATKRKVLNMFAK